VIEITAMLPCLKEKARSALSVVEFTPL